ncbi:UbiH/UbiF/VisC/COQ6 family ubiquinone biosynthesis hydroxylase [Noviherbaspirillum denitrificans]|uniref:2-octaprenyl-6-methoxyphenyl hydroxylase n=1 Tax=Noviherbaspirillum denitrificans TaxID=1968433 RepID=A0A254TH60_9BURK|nr:UbiH/UbiF/VisC/COQ6 family ubiquinone biosynthesis hydroxylase [Noviherbaspirillum denitrificans]OWW21986.1 2-octaprenyl-6-methoxyphenyl hydroxylase [Noviherbaspirillum denitrificans]
MAATDYDIAICGAGPVGMALALLLVKRGATATRIALIDAKTLEQVNKDPRSLALSYGSIQILEEIGGWPVASDAIHDIHVSRRGHFGRTVLTPEEYGVPALGYVTRYGAIVSALSAAVKQTDIAVLRPLQVSSTMERDDMVELHCADGKTITAGIMVQAEGGVFNEQDARTVRRDYEQTAIISNVIASAPIPHRAFERFTDEGPLALLPQEGGYALVWCVHPDTASRLQALSDTAFLAELGAAFGSRVGRFTSATPRIAYPLGLNAHTAASARTVAIGNAAQTLHPVAGQGLNLGLRDAAVLARMLDGEMETDVLLRFAAQRQADRRLTISLTDTLARIFAQGPGGAVPQSMLGLSLALMDTMKPVKRLLAEQMMFGHR